MDWISSDQDLWEGFYENGDKPSEFVKLNFLVLPFNNCRLSNEASPSIRDEFESTCEWYHNCVNILNVLGSWSYFLMKFSKDFEMYAVISRILT